MERLRDTVLASLPERFSQAPYLVKAGGAIDYCLARSNAAKKHRDTGERQEVGWRSRKNPSQSCRIKPESVTKDGIYPRIAGPQVQSEYYKPIAECIFKRKNGRYTLHALIQDVWACETQASGAVVAIDPGIRTFLAWYAGDSCGKIGEQDFNRIFRLCKNLDGLISKQASSRNHRERRALKKAAARLRNRIGDLVAELHRKAALFFASNFDVILLPTFETKQMTERAMRRISSKQARSMLTFSHFRFKQYIKHKALQHGKTVVDVNEAYTSKTISWTGEVKQIGTARHISSGRGPEKVVVDRDYNGARGIMLRALRASSLKAI
jgi:putative transposase